MNAVSATYAGVSNLKCLWMWWGWAESDQTTFSTPFKENIVIYNSKPAITDPIDISIETTSKNTRRDCFRPFMVTHCETAPKWIKAHPKQF